MNSPPSRQSDLPMSQGPILLLSSDSNFGQHVGVTLYSVLSNYHGQMPITVYILTTGLLPVDQERLLRLGHQFQAEIHLLLVEPAQVEGLKVSKHISAATYFRLLAGRLLPERVEKVLYLDSDLLILDDIGALWNVDITEYALAAVVDQGNNKRPELGIESPADYFNAGVTLLNLKQWRGEDIGNQVLQFVRDHTEMIQYWDQDGMNAILRGRWLGLPLRWNVQNILYDANPARSNPVLDPNERAEALKNPAILHFTGKSKPWFYMSLHPRRGTYWDHLHMTEWRDFQPPDKTARNVILKWQILLKRKLRALFPQG